MFSVQMDYPNAEEEKEVLSRIDTIETRRCEQILTTDEIVESIEAVRQIFVSDAVKNYIVSLVGYLRNSPDVKTPPGTERLDCATQRSQGARLS